MTFRAAVPLALISIVAGFGLYPDSKARADLGPVVVSQVKDADPGPGDGDPLQTGDANLGGVLIYDAKDGFGAGGHGHEIWRSDGTEAGTHLLKDIAPGEVFSSIPGEFTEFQGDVYFAASESSLVGSELWRTDGTTEGTELFMDLNPFVFEPGVPTNASSPSQLTVVGDTLFFLANSDGLDGYELWKTDGTVGGTSMVKDIESDLSRPAYNLTAVGERLFFTYRDDTHGKELWTSDGTFAGTTIVEDIGPGAAHGLLYPNVPQATMDYYAFDGILYFAADDGTNGAELWRSDGTEPGTFMVKDINGNSGSSINFGGGFAEMGGELFFSWDFGLQKTDGTGPGTGPVTVPGGSGTPESLTRVGDRLFFVGTLGRLFKTDGTGPGTELVIDVEPPIQRLTAFDDNLHFVFDDGIHGVELWRTDGSVAGTERLTDINPAGGSLVNRPVVAGDRLFFRGDDDGATGIELWQVLADRTPPVTTINSGPAEGENLAVGEAAFAFSSNESGSTFSCVLDGGAPEPCDAGTIAYTDLSEGGHTFRVTATDAAPFNNVEPVPATRNFTFGIQDPNPNDPNDPGAGDSDGPVLRLKAKKRQSSPHRIVLTARCLDEACALKAKGKISVKVRRPDGKARTRKLNLKVTRKRAEAGQAIKLKLRLPKKAKRLVRKALGEKRASKSRITVWATDEAGNTTRRIRAVKVMRKKAQRKPARGTRS